MAEIIHSLFDMLLRRFILPRYQPVVGPDIPLYSASPPPPPRKLLGFEKETTITIRPKQVVCVPSESDYTMYTPSYCLRTCSVFRESLRSVTTYFGDQRNQPHQTNPDDQLERNRMHAYVCSLYNYAHIGDYGRFLLQYRSETNSIIYNRVRTETLRAIDVDIDIICNTILVALDVGILPLDGTKEKEIYIWTNAAINSNHINNSGNSNIICCSGKGKNSRCVATEVIGDITYKVIMNGQRFP
jgi:hypothetical protein